MRIVPKKKEGDAGGATSPFFANVGKIHLQSESLLSSPRDGCVAVRGLFFNLDLFHFFCSGSRLTGQAYC